MDCKNLIDRECLRYIHIITGNYFKDTSSLSYFKNTVDKYNGEFYSSPLFINGLIPYSSHLFFQDCPNVLYYINDMFQFPMGKWRLSAVEINKFENLEVYEHVDDANTNGNRIRVLGFKFEDSQDEKQICGELKINGETVYLKNNSIVELDCSLPHSAKLNGKGAFIIFDFIPAELKVKDLISSSLLPQYYYLGKIVKEPDNMVYVVETDTTGKTFKYVHEKALKHYNFDPSICSGISGRCYGIPFTSNGEGLPFSETKKYIKEFLEYAKLNPDITFDLREVNNIIPRVYVYSIIKNAFKDAPENCIFPIEWAR